MKVNNLDIEVENVHRSYTLNATCIFNSFFFFLPTICRIILKGFCFFGQCGIFLTFIVVLKWFSWITVLFIKIFPESFAELDQNQVGWSEQCWIKVLCGDSSSSGCRVKTKLSDSVKLPAPRNARTMKVISITCFLLEGVFSDWRGGVQYCASYGNELDFLRHLPAETNYRFTLSWKLANTQRSSCR